MIGFSCEYISSIGLEKSKKPQTLVLNEDSELAGCSKAPGPRWRQLQCLQKRAITT